MLSLLIKRLLQTIPILIGVSLLIFGLVRFVPGNPIDYLVPVEATPDLVARLKATYGLDRPLYVQYALWLGNALSGDFGVSIVSGEPVLPELLDALGNTALIALPAALIAFVVGTVLGTIGAFRQGRAADRVGSMVAISGVSLPNYWVAVVLVMIFSVILRWLPAQGKSFDGWPATTQDLACLMMPIAALALIPLGVVARVVRTTLLEVLAQDFIDALRAKGLTQRQVIFHALKNAAPGVLSVMGLQLGYLLSGSILIETIFNWPGAGGLLNLAVFRRDIPVLQATVLVLAAAFVMLNMLVDVARSLIDVRLRS
ncbi:ABC transporter permease [Xanthobacter versatilis]|uniref:ABC transporter permease n=1 Tax=Xanthobacter autotrophicus (strain ATCC BAA-1158 / Py2) TaxID=78245 RepID=UPI003728E020